MRSADLLRRLRRLATRRGWSLEITEGGRHTRVRLQGRFAPVPRHAADLPSGTLRAILRQLGITAADLED
ncbi:MAG: type II toxin-antitoxin system HicA family toxin [Acetobacteraceae bacterium]|nr:type II toxin-antitoxin system HicA family toxin [Acetobacteraceae bacterium]